MAAQRAKCICRRKPECACDAAARLVEASKVYWLLATTKTDPTAYRIVTRFDA